MIAVPSRRTRNVVAPTPSIDPFASSDDAHAPWALQVGERIAQAEASGEVRIEIEDDAR